MAESITIVGREDELRRIAAHLAPRSTLALVGPSGIGKTMLAREVAARHPNAVVVDCFGLGPDEVAAALVEASGRTPTWSPPTSDLWMLAAEALESMDLLVLDDLRMDDVDLGAFRRSWGGALLVTTQNPGSDVTVLSVGPLPSADAVELFTRAARAENLAFELADADRAVVEQIVENLGCVALGVALAARRAAQTSPATALQLLERDGLGDPRRPERHRSFRAAIRHSWDQLEPAAQRRLYVLTLFERPIRPWMVAEVTEEELDAAVEGLADLVRRGFVSTGDFPRALEAFIEPTRAAYEREFPAEARRIRERIVQLGVELARALPRGMHSISDLGEGPSFWQFCLADSDLEVDDEAYAVVLAAWFRWLTLRGRSHGGLVDLDRGGVEAHLRRGDWNAWFQAARMYLRQAGAAKPYLDRCLELVSSDAERRDTHTLLAYVAGQHQDWARAREHVDHATAFTAQGDLTAVVLAEVMTHCGMTEVAREVVARVDPGTLQAASRAYCYQVRAFCSESDHAAAHDLERAEAWFREAGTTIGHVNALVTLGRFHVDRTGDVDAALQWYAEARPGAMRLADGRALWHVDTFEAIARLMRGDAADAVRLCERDDERSLEFADVRALIRFAAHWACGSEPGAPWAPVSERWATLALPMFVGLWRVTDVAWSLRAGEDAKRVVRRHREATKSVATAMKALAAHHALSADSDLGTALNAWGAVRDLLTDTSLDYGVRVARNVIRANLTPTLARLQALEDAPAQICVFGNYEAFRAGGAWTDLSDHPVSSQLFQLLVEAEGPVDYEQLCARLYPGDQSLVDALLNRVNVLLARLRKAGLKPYLVKRAEGFVLNATVHLE